MRNRYLLVLDVLLVVLGAFAAFALRFDLRVLDSAPTLVPFTVAALLIKLPLFWWFGLYRRMWAYASSDDMLRVVVAVTTASVVLFAVVLTWTTFELVAFSRAVILSDWVIGLVLVGGVRAAVRFTTDARHRGAASDGPGRAALVRRVLIIGAGKAGVLAVREIAANPNLRMTVVGFADDDPAKVGKLIQGIPVLGTTENLSTLLQRTPVHEALITMPTAPGSALRRISKACGDVQLPSRVMPGVYELLDGRATLNRLRPLEIADLLRRAPVGSATESIKYIAGRIVMVTGAGGSIGRELARQLAALAPRRLILLGHGENSLHDVRLELAASHPHLAVDVALVDVRDEGRLRRVFAECLPDVILHAAAHKHVPLMEENAEEAITNNVVGTANVVRLAIETGVERLVAISTDKAVAPSSVMGASKRLAEMIVRSAAARHKGHFSVVRFGNVLGSRGSVVPLFTKQIEAGGPVTVTHPEMRRFFMTIPEAVHLVLQAGGIQGDNEIFVLEMGEPVRIVDLVRDLAELSGHDPDEIPIVFTGIRPGEKLSEELWEPGATVARTECSGVLRVSEADRLPSDGGAAMIDELLRAARSGTRVELDAAFHRWIPSYRADDLAQARRSAAVAPHS